MIFKTFQSELDGISNKIGFSKRSFAEWGKQVSTSFKESEGVVNSFKNALKTAFIIPIEKDNGWIKNKLGDIVNKGNIDSYIPQFTSEKASNLAQEIREQSIALADAKEGWEEYFAILKGRNQDYIIDLIKNTDDLSKLTGEDLVKANQQARASALAHNEAIKAQTFSAKAGKVALQALATVGNMIAMWGVSELVKGFYDLATATDRFADSASDIGSTLSGTTTDMSSYKKETQELWATINDQSSSIEDTTAARQRLMEIQDELLDKYGDEKDAIKLVTDAVKENTTAFDDFSFSQYQEAMNQFISDNSGFWDKLAYSATGNDSVKESMISTMEKYLAYDNDHLFENIQKQLGSDLFDQILNANDVQQVAGAITGNIDNVTTAISQLQDALTMNESSMDDTTFEKLNQGLALQSTQASELADKYSELYNQYILYEKILTDSGENGYAESLNEITEAYKKYQEATVTGDSDKIEQSFNDYATILQNSLNSTLTDPENGEVVAKYFREMFPTLQEEFSKWQFKIDFDVENGGIKEEVEAYAKEFSNSSDIINFDARISNTDEQISAYNSLIDIASKYHMEIDQLVSIMEEFGLVASREKENLISTLSGNEQNLIVEDWVKSLTDEEAGMANSTAFDEALKRQMEELNGAALSAENYSAALEEVKSSQNDIGNDEIAISPLSISQTIDQLNTQIKPAFDSLKSAWQEIFTDDGFALNSIDILSTCDSIKSKLDEMSEIGLNVDYSAFEDFVTVLNDTESTEYDVENAFDSLATSITQAGLSGTEDFETMKAALEDLGVVNNEMVAFDNLISKTNALADAGIDLVNATEAEMQAFVDESVSAEHAGEALALLQLKKALINQTTITTAADCQNILALAQAANVGIVYLEQLNTLMNLITQRDSAQASGDSRAVSELNRAIRDFSANVVNNLNLDDVKVDFSPIGSGAKSAGSKAGKDYKDALKEQLSDLDSVISGITGRIDDQISFINEQKSTALDSIDAQKEALEEAKDAAVEALEAERDARLEVIETQKKQLEEQIKLIDKQIKQKQDEIKAIEDAASARKRELDLQKAQYDLERMQNQRTKLVYSEEKGMHYEADTSGIRDAKEAVDDAKRQIEIANIQKEIDLLEDQKDLLNESLDLLSEQEDQINYHYDNLISQTEKYYDQQIKALEKQRKSTESYFESIIKNLENSKSKYQELTEILEKAELSAKLKQLGIDEEALLNGSEEEFNKLKDAYMNIVTQLNSGNDEVLDSLRELSGYDGTAPTMLEESNTELNTMNDNLATSNTNVGTVNSSLADTATKTSDVATNVSTLNDNLSQVNGLITEEQASFNNLKEKIDEVITKIKEKTSAIQEEQQIVGGAVSSEMVDFLLLKGKIDEVQQSIGSIGDTINQLDSSAILKLLDAFQLLYNKLVLISITLGAGMEGAEEGAVGGIASAIQALNEISLEEGIIAQFTNLKTAIDEVTSAIGGGGGGDSEGSAGGEGSGSSGGKTGGVQSGGKGSKGEGNGGGDSLTGAIETMGETAKEVIGEPDAEGDGTVIGEFGALETAVTDVTSAIGGGESEGSEGQGKGSGGEGESGEGNLISSIKNLGETTEETLGEPGGDGVIGRFEQFKQPIQEADEHVHSISDGLAAIDGQEVECTITVNVKMNGGLPGAIGAGMNLGSATYEAKYLGNSHVEGTALASGNWAVQANEQSALLGEVGYEIIVRNGKFFTVGDNGPEMFPIKKGDIVFNHQQSVELLKNGHTSGRGKAYADGTVGGGKILTKDGEILRPLQPGDRAYDLMQKFDTYFKSIDGNLDILTVNARARYEKQMDELAKHVTNVSNVTNNRNVQPVINGGINITCPGITSQEVARQVGVELDNMFNGMHLDAEQRSRMR